MIPPTRTSQPTTFFDRTQGNARKRKFRTSIASSKDSSHVGAAYESVSVPLGEADFTDPGVDDENDWIAENLSHFCNDIQIIWQASAYGNYEWNQIKSMDEALPNRGYPKGASYFWKTDNGELKQLHVHNYCEAVLDWVETMFFNEEYFPVDENEPYGPKFRKMVTKMYTRLFRVFAVLFSNPSLSGLVEGKKENQGHAHARTVFLKFMFFVWRWELVPEAEQQCISFAIQPVLELYKREEEKHLRRIGAAP